MVFESLVVDLLNRFLGQYVENLDASQLKLGIWGGDAVLENLDVKEGALDELDLPVKIKSGHLGKLTLKIPWKNLYSAPVEASIEGLYVIVAPNTDIKYDAEKDAKQKFEAKQRILQHVEATKQKEKEKEEGKEKNPKGDSFVEKMATQVIKNLQVKVADIHLRYEDKTTNPDAPFAIGATLHNISLKTTDTNWKECLADASTKLIYKMLRLDCLSVYWNCNSELYSGLDRPQQQAKMKNTITADPQNTPGDFQYLVEPISLKAQLKLNTKPENDLSNPKAWLNLVIDSIGLAFRKKQFRDVMQMLDSFERMSRNEPFRKYRPTNPLKGNAKVWWHYAMNSILEETVRRRHKMWSWKHIKEHRRMLKEYKQLYVKKLDTSKPGKDLIANLEKIEKQLSVMNITMCRQQAEVEFQRLGKKRAKEKAEKGWFGGWFGGGKKAKAKKEGGDLEDIAGRFQEAMTAEEKAKLFDAIGYSEKSADPAFPKEYVGVQAHLNLKSTSVKILDEERKKQQLLNLSVTELTANFSQRPAAEAIKLEAKLDDFSVFGTPVEEGTSPQMVESQSLEADKKYSLLSLSVETNPMDGKADQRIRLNARPLKIAYDANTINQIVKFFEPPKDVHLDDLSAAAVSSLGDFTVQSSTGLQYIVDNKNILDVNIDIKASYVIIPENGINDGRGSVLIVDLGNFKMATVNEERPKGPRMENESLEELMKKAYDRFQIELQSVQVILAAEGDDWQAARELKGSPLHLLQPLDLNVGLNKCMVEDSRLAKIKITGELPDVTVDVSDFKLQELLKLGLSIPLPESSQKEPEPKFARDQLPVSPRLSPVLAVASDSPDGPVVVSPDDQSDSSDSEEYYSASERFLDQRDPIVPSDRPVKATVGEGGTAKPTLEKNESMADMQRTNLELQFELKKVGLNLSQRSSGEDKPLISIAIHSLGTQVQMRPWDMNASVSLGSVSVQHMQFQALDGGDLYLVRTPAYEKGTDRLLSINYQKAEKSNPEFSTTYQSTEQNITVKFTTLEVVAHSDAILNMTDFADTLVASLDTGKKEEPGEASDTEDEGYLSEDEKKPKGRRVKKVKPSETIDVKVTANLDIISLVLCTKDTCLTEVYIKGLEAGVLLQKHVTTVTASLHDITVTDPTPGALHPKIVSIVDDEVFKVKAELFNGATAADGYSDMSAVDIRVGLSMGRMRAIFLNKFVMRLLSFVDQFSRAKAAAAEASANAAAAAKKTAENLQERCVRIALDIIIKAPLIIIPKGYTSDKALVADLGQLLVQNSFSIAAGTEGRELPAVLDKMEVALQSIQLSRAILEGGRIKSEVLMLEPMGLNVDLTRNLAASWYHHAPAVALFGKLRTIKVCIGPDDFALMMGILNENIAEGQPDTPSEESPAASGGKSTAAGEGVTAEAKAETAKEPQSATAPSETTEEPWEQICVDFELEGIYASLYTGKLDLRPTEGRQERVAHEALGCFAICHLGVKASIQSNQAITASAKLAKILLDDIRPGRGDGITRMLGSHGDDADDMETISVKFEQKANQDKNIDASVRNFHACVCAEFLMTVAEIFTKGLEESQVVKKEEKKKPIKAVTQTPTNTPTGTPEATEAPPVGVITIKALLDNPEIVLVADSSKKDTNALVLRTLGEVNMKLAGKTMSIKGGLQQLRINACPYLEDQRKGKMTKVLIPCNVDFNLNTPEGKGQHISVVIEQLALNISPEVIKVLSSVSQTLAPPKTETAEEKRSKAIVPADLWDAKKIADSNFWFLKDETEEALDVNTLLEEAVVGAVEQPKGEELVATINSIVIKLEASVGRRTVPMLTVDASMEAVVKDWSSKLHVDTHMTVEIACYNEKASAWEPLLEPLEAEPGQHKPWDISLEVVKNEDLIDVSSVAASGETEDEDDSIHLAPPVMTVTLSSGSMLQLTMTKTCIEMLTNLGKAFGEAMSDPNTTIKDDSVVHACTVINRTGLSLVVQAGSYYAMPTGATSDGKYSLKNNAQVGLSLATAAMATMKQKSILKSGETDLKRELSIQIEGYQEVSGIAIYRAGKVLYNLTPSKKTSSAIVISVVLDVEAHLDSRTVTIRSPLQLFNHFEMDVEIYTRVSNWTEKLGTVKGSETFVVPLNVAHSDQLLIKPLDKSCDVEYSLCDAPVMWQKLWEELQKGQGSVTFKCPCKTEGYTPFFINIVTEPDTMRFVHGNSLTAPKFTLHLYPVVILHNLMPIPLAYTLAGSGVEVKVNPTEKSQLANVDMGKTMVMISLLGYAGTDWRGEITLRPGLKEFFQLGFKGGASNELWLELGVMADYSGGYLEMAIFAPYWLINKTGLSLAYKAGNDVIEHPPDKKEPILFAYPTNKGFSPGKNKICMKVGESNWSDKFSLDAVGSTGFISCKTDEKTTEAQGTGASKPKKYSVGVQIQLSNFGMTKIVVFNPRYLLINQTEFPIRCAERYQEKLVEVQPKECIAFWPTDKKNNPMMVVMAEDSTEKSLPFLYTDPHTTVLKLDSKLGGIIVDTSVTETATVVSFESFSKGNFTVQLINHTDNMPVKYHQINVKEEKTLLPGEAVLYTWQNPTEKRELVWNVGEKDHRNDLIKDGIGEFKHEGQQVYWACFLDGTQRMLCFTEDLAVATRPSEAATLEQSDLELVLSLPGIGLSLVNNLTRTEVAYIGIISSGIIWQNKIRRRWRDMNGKQMKLLEDGYQKAQNELVTDKDAPPKLTKLEKDFEVDFRAMTMKQPQHRPIRRTYHTGMWAQVRTSKHQLQVHVMIHRIQIDNQMPAAIFQTVLAPIPPPKSVSAESVPKPMIEFSLMMRESEHSKVKQIKYLKLLIQEMAVKVDIGFITSLAAVFQSGQETTGMELKWMEDDLKVCTTTFMDEEAVKVALAGNVNFFDNFHLSPLKTHVSFSLSDTGGENDLSAVTKKASVQQNAMRLILQSVGVTLTNIDDVVFKLGFFEREHQFYSQQQLQSEIVSHYANQAIKQLYVLVLGLDVIGNPFGFVRGVQTGVVDFFYEPYQGIVQGPEEFAEGVALGMRSLFGHAVGGAAGAVSRITGTLGKGLAALTMDEEYKRKRQQAINQKPATFQEGLARGGKGLVMGFVDGVTGVVKNPFQGAKKEGAKGFFKGVGKGLAGVVAKPTGGVIDFASSTFEGIRRVTDMSEDVVRLRFPRYLHLDGIVRPYEKHEAEGQNLFHQIDKGKFSQTEDYVAHMLLTADKKHYLVATDKRLILTSKGEVLGHWNVEFQYPYKDLKDTPALTEKGLQIITKEDAEKGKKKGFGLGLLKGKSGQGKMVHITDRKEAEYFISKVKEAMDKALKATE